MSMMTCGMKSAVLPSSPSLLSSSVAHHWNNPEKQSNVKGQRNNRGLGNNVFVLCCTLFCVLIGSSCMRRNVKETLAVYPISLQLHTQKVYSEKGQRLTSLLCRYTSYEV